ncbi:hypothetical protein M422DRAFT_263662 [Sphaerobolus stellatus SS14]|uniref:Uncharacterized protein n=1 Tax=Sphaerobolus stellatus (strain SS14) TaxID=990650 RepID=A0A0C9UYH6_SPHS4|nr:hypothetical protein M422DRAFT_263662 [Sphaerobolus stellatus SS14]
MLELNILEPSPNGKKCFMNILFIFQASTELEEVSIEFDTHGQSTPTSSSHRLSLKSLKNVILVGTDAAQLIDYIEAPSLEQLCVYFGYTLSLLSFVTLSHGSTFQVSKHSSCAKSPLEMWKASIWMIDFVLEPTHIKEWVAIHHLWIKSSLRIRGRLVGLPILFWDIQK